MRHVKKGTVSTSRPLVGIAVDGASGFGRGILRGAMQYINAQRRWEIHSVLRRTFESKHSWPKCDGTIVGGVGTELSKIVRSKSRFVVSCSGSSDPDQAMIVCLDDHAVGAMAAEHLMDCQLASFAFCGLKASVKHSANREQGFRDALKRRGYCHVASSSMHDPVNTAGLKHRDKLIAWLRELPKPVGILAVDDTAAVDLAAACRHANLGVPEHVAIIGVNNDDLICDSAWSPISSIDGGFARIGFAAARMMDRLISGERIAIEERCIRLPPLRAVQRLSTNILAVNDPPIAKAVRYIREHACDPCSVEDILRQVPTGRRQLERQFKSKLGRTPRDEILRVQMETAKRLLLQTNLRLPEIADRCGFSGAPNLGRAFLREFNTSPAAFRRSVPHQPWQK